MKDEIKEILDKLKDSIEYPKIDMPTFDGTDSEYFDNDTLLGPNECKILLDYITNLQEELEDLRESDWAWHQTLKAQNKREYRSKFLKEFQQEYNTNTFPDYDEIYKRYDKLKKENERLKENAIHNDKVVDKAKWNEMLYKSRNEKATKLLKEAGCYDEETKTFCDDVWEELPELLNILQGDDNNVKD